MKEIFSEYFPLSKEEADLIWNECLFVFDTNVLLNFYRYSRDTIIELQKAISTYNNRVWIPYNVGIEFFENRTKVINEQVNNYQYNAKILTDLLKSFSATKGHPFISLALLDKLKEINDEVTKELYKSKKDMSNLIHKADWILDMITELFNNNVGESYNSEQLSLLYIEGEKRYSNMIPPGFMDAHKSEQKKFGDFIIWKQIIEKSVSSKKSVIFITDDEKEDWYLKQNNRIISPLPALIKKFNLVTSYNYYSYSTADFLKKASIDMNQEVNESALEEIESLSSRKADGQGKINNYFKIEFVINIENGSDNSINQFQDTISQKGYHIILLDRNDKILYYSLTVPFEDLERRFYKIVNQLIILFEFKLLSFSSDTTNYSYSD